MSPFPPFFALFLVSLIVAIADARPITEESNSDDLTSYWRIATNNQPLPEALQALFPTALEKTHYHHFSEWLKKDPNAFYLNSYFPADHKKDGGSNDLDTEHSDNDHNIKTVRPKDPNGFYLNGYFPADHKKDGGSNDVDTKISGNDQITKTFSPRDPNAFYLNGYFPAELKKDGRLNGELSGNDDITTTVRPRDPNAFYLNGYFPAEHKKDGGSNIELSDNDHITKTSRPKDPNALYFGYFPADHKKNGGSNDVEVAGNDHTAKTLQRDTNGAYFGYFPAVQHKKDSELTNVEPKVDGNPRTLTKDMDVKKDTVMDEAEDVKLVVFTPSDLYIGKKFLTIFPYVSSPSGSSSSFPKFIPRHVADSLPFSPEHLPDLMRIFGIQSPDSSWVEILRQTQKSCEKLSHMGNDVFCATSLESLLDSARNTIGSNYEVNVISTTHLTKPSYDGSIETPQKYTLLEAPKEIESPKKLNCHPMTYLYPIYGCHSVKDTKVYRLLLEGEDKIKVDAVAICHMDTSIWKPDAPFLLATGLKPGEGAVCHFMQPSHLSIYASESTGVAAAI